MTNHSVILTRPAGTLTVTTYGATRRVEGRTPDGTRAFSFDVSPSLLPGVRRVTEQALRGETAALRLSGWNVSLSSSEPLEPGGPFTLSLSVPGQPYPWHLHEHEASGDLHRQISRFLHLLG